MSSGRLDSRLREGVAEDLQRLSDGIKTRDNALTALNHEMALVRKDYEHNYNLLQKQAAELSQLRAVLRVRDDEIAALEGKCAAQVHKLDGNEEDLKRYTASLHAKVETLAAQLSVVTSEKSMCERQNSEYSMEVASLRRELQQQHAKHLRALEAVRSEVGGEAEQQLLQKERMLKSREDALQRETRQAELRVLEHHGDATRAVDEARKLHAEVEELRRTVAHKESSLEQLQQQLVDVRRLAAQQRSALECENLELAGAGDHRDRSTLQHMQALRKELERRTEERDALEAKLAALRSQHEAEARRWADERIAHVGGFEDRLRAVSDKALAAESREGAVADDLARARRRLADATAKLAQQEADAAAMRERLDDAEHRISLKDDELSRAQATIRRLQDDCASLRKTNETLLAEVDRRDWRDRSRVEIAARTRAESEEAATAGISAPPRPLLMPAGGAVPAAPSLDTSVVGLLTDIRSALKDKDPNLTHTSSTKTAIGEAGGADVSEALRRLQQERAWDNLQLRREIEAMRADAERSRRHAERLRSSNAALGAELSYSGPAANAAVVAESIVRTPYHRDERPVPAEHANAADPTPRNVSFDGPDAVVGRPLRPSSSGSRGPSRAPSYVLDTTVSAIRSANVSEPFVSHDVSVDLDRSTRQDHHDANMRNKRIVDDAAQHHQSRRAGASVPEHSSKVGAKHQGRPVPFRR